MGLLNLPIPTSYTSDFPIVQYADDTLLVMEADTKQLFFLKALLNSFSLSTGLKVNYNKSMMIPINVSEEKLDILAGTFGCVKGELPFIYLGLPLGISRPKNQDFLPLVNKCERRLVGFSSFLNLAGRLQLTNAVLSALPTFFMCTLALPKGIIKQIDKYRKHCLWRGSDINAKTPPKAAWTMVCTPKAQGGLGVIDIEKQNKALLMKNLHKFYNKSDVPWVNLVWEKHYKNGKLPSHIKKGSFWWRDTLKILPDFKQMATPHPHLGDSILLWLDSWEGQPLRDLVPELFSFAINKRITVRQALDFDDFSEAFQLPLSQPAFEQFQSVQHALTQHTPGDTNKDIWAYKWGSNIFSSAKIYRSLAGQNDMHLVFKWLWKNNCQPKHKVFF